MDLRGIEFFLTVAEEGSISRAAERLHISQPTVSREMMELERELGKTLLVRTSRNVSLTPDGLLFRDTARDMLALYRKAVTQQAEPVELAGDIYLGAGETESFSFMAEQIKAFREEHWVSPVLIWKKQAVHAPAARAFLKSLGYSEYE